MPPGTSQAFSSFAFIRMLLYLRMGYTTGAGGCFHSNGPRMDSDAHTGTSLPESGPTPAIPPSPATDPPLEEPRATSRRRRVTTGGLKNLPVMMPANEMLSRATREALRARVSEDDTSGHKLYTQSLDPTLTQQALLVSSKKGYIRSLPCTPVHRSTSRGSRTQGCGRASRELSSECLALDPRQC
jgi:hypothetical protein